MEYDAWHWCTNCSNWPLTNYETRDSKPSSNELCDVCFSKDKKGTCNKS